MKNIQLNHIVINASHEPAKKAAGCASHLLLGQETLGLLHTWAQAAYPYEGCGLFLGVQTAYGPRVELATVEQNLHQARARDRYELDPSGFMRAQARAETLGMDIVGVWHSHPEHSSAASEIDRAQAWSGWSYVILSVIAGRVADVRSWRLHGGQFIEEPICRA